MGKNGIWFVSYFTATINFKYCTICFQGLFILCVLDVIPLLQYTELVIYKNKNHIKMQFWCDNEWKRSLTSFYFLFGSNVDMGSRCIFLSVISSIKLRWNESLNIHVFIPLNVFRGYNYYFLKLYNSPHFTLVFLYFPSQRAARRPLNFTPSDHSPPKIN